MVKNSASPKRPFFFLDFVFHFSPFSKSKSYLKIFLVFFKSRFTSQMSNSVNGNPFMEASIPCLPFFIYFFLFSSEK